MNLKVIGEKIVVKKVQKLRTEAGIILPDISEEPITEGEIVGIGKMNEDCSGLKLGDVIVYYAYAGTDFVFEGEKLRVIRPNDVVGLKPVKKAKPLIQVAN